MSRKLVTVAATLVVAGLALSLLLTTVGRKQDQSAATIEAVLFAGKPAWVITSARSLRRVFLGRPRLVSVSYRDGPKGRRLTIKLDRRATCGACSHPPGTQPVSGDHATAMFDARTHREVGFSVG